MTMAIKAAATTTAAKSVQSWSIKSMETQLWQMGKNSGNKGKL